MALSATTKPTSRYSSGIHCGARPVLHIFGPSIACLLELRVFDSSSPVVCPCSSSITMKLPFSKEDHNKRMALTPEAQNRREILFDLRETSLLGNGSPVPRVMVDKSVQYDNMDFTASPEYNGGASFNSYSSPPISVEPTISSERSPYSQNETVPAFQMEKDETIKAWQRDLTDKMALDGAAVVPPAPPVPPVDAMPRYKINESNPTSPGAGDPHNNTSTWRIRDRDRDRSSSGSEDDIEKLDDVSPDSEKETDEKHRAKAKTEWLQEARDGDTGAGRGRGGKSGGPADSPDSDEDCCIQCLSYAIQCCECVIS